MPACNTHLLVSMTTRFKRKACRKTDRIRDGQADTEWKEHRHPGRTQAPRQNTGTGAEHRHPGRTQAPRQKYDR